jgi:type IV secretion system protein VirB8
MNKEAEAYFAEASRWEFDRTAALTSTARRAWIVALISVGIAMLSTAALAMLTPLKHVEPFVVRVDSSTGIVDVVPGYAGTEALPESVTRFLVTQYVMERERYVPALAETDYEQVGAYHTAAMNQGWATTWARSNPESPLNRFADGTLVQAQVQSVSFLRHVRGEPDLVQVRFVSELQRGTNAATERSHFVATLQVAFAAPSSDVHVRALNPLGFKVLEYRREPEVVQAGGAPPPSGPAAESATTAANP